MFETSVSVRAQPRSIQTVGVSVHAPLGLRLSGAESSWPSRPAVKPTSAPPEGSCGSRPAAGGQAPPSGLHTHTRLLLHLYSDPCTGLHSLL